MPSCSICIENITTTQFKTNCNHIFHNECLMHWLVENDTCPSCRKNLTGTCNLHNSEDSEDSEDIYENTLYNIIYRGDEPITENMYNQIILRIYDYINSFDDEYCKYKWKDNSLNESYTVIKFKKFTVFLKFEYYILNNNIEINCKIKENIVKKFKKKYNNKYNNYLIR